MPEFTVKEVRLPELHLPEIKRDEIVRSLSGIRIPDVDFSVGDRRKLLGGRTFRAIPWRKTGLSTDDLGKLIAAGVAAARFVRPEPRSRWPMIRRSRAGLVAVVRPAPRRTGRRFVILAILAGTIAGWLVLRNPANRLRINRAARNARKRIDEIRNNGVEDLDLDAGEPVSITTTEVAGTPEHDVAQPEATMTTQEAIEPA